MRYLNAVALGTVLLAATAPLFAQGNGLKGEYFNNTGLTGTPAVTRTDAKLDFTWPGSPASGVPTNYFSVRWTGKVEAPATGAYRFATYSNDGVRVWLNGTPIINNWTAHSRTRDSSDAINLTGGQKYDLKVEFYDNSSLASIDLLWSYPGQPETHVPKTRLYSDAVTAAPTPVYLSEWTPLTALNGWGPYEKDRSNGETRARDGHTLSIGGMRYGRGLGVHARSELEYALGGRFQSFLADVGVDDEVGSRGTVVFEVWADGTRKFASSVLRGGGAAVPVSVDITGAQRLKLVVLHSGDGEGYDHADWGGARVTQAAPTTPTPPTPGTPSTPPPSPLPGTPTGLTAAGGNGQVTVSWNPVNGATGYNLFRSTIAGSQGSQIGAGLSSTAFINTGLVNGTLYYFSVAATNASGSSPVSAQVSAKPVAPTPATPTGLTATPGNAQVTLAWNSVGGASGYDVYRSTAAGSQGSKIASALATPGFVNTGLTNGTTYFYSVAARNGDVSSPASAQVSAKPAAPPVPPAPTGLTAVPGNTEVTLTWNAPEAATSYNVYRSTTSGGQSLASPLVTGLTSPTFKDTGLTNNTTYYYRVAGVNTHGTGTWSSQASAKPVPPPVPPAPTGLTATPGNGQVTLSWNTAERATSYNVYRGTSSGGQGTTPLATGITGVTFLDNTVINGTVYYYKVAGVNQTGVGSRSAEASATPTPAPLTLTDAQKDAYRFLRHATWGPTPVLMDRVAQDGKAAFLDEQFSAPTSEYPQALIDMNNMELLSERFFQNGLQGQDQLRQRVAWALSQIWVVSAVKVNNSRAMGPYIRMLHENAFGNVRDLLERVTLDPAMGEFLDMVNNKKADPTRGTMPNENYARELMQLFTIGLVRLNPDGTATATPAYAEADVLEMARVFTGWTYGDAVAGDPTRQNSRYYGGPMEPWNAQHDTGAKTILGASFPANQTARADLAQALDVLFNHPNIAPFLSKQLIQKLVKSDPSPAYVRDVAQVFANNGAGVRGDMRAIVRAILLHPEAAAANNSGKFAEPALFLLTLARALNSTVTDFPYMSDFSESMNQRIWFAPSVFNYFSPGYRLNGVLGPELQIWSTATAMTRVNFVASLVSGRFGTNFVIDTSALTPYAGNPAALVDAANTLLMGGQMKSDMRQAILTALAASTSNTDRIRGVIYLIATSMQYQVEQ